MLKYDLLFVKLQNALSNLNPRLSRTRPILSKLRPYLFE